MKKRIIIFAVFLFAFQVSKSEQMKENIDGVICDTCCSTVTKLVSQFCKINNCTAGTVIDYEELFTMIESVERSKYSFPSSEEESKLWYDVINKHKTLAKTNSQVLKFLLRYSVLKKKNVEISEFFNFLIPELALGNPRLFVEVLTDFDKESRDDIYEDFEYFKGPVPFKKFRLELSKIKDERFKNIVGEIQYALNEV